MKNIAVLSDPGDALAISAILGREYDVIRIGRFSEIRWSEATIVICGADTPAGADWRELLWQLRVLGLGIALIVCSKHADDRLWAEALNLGAHNVLSKPFEADELRRVIEHAASRELIAA